MPHPPPLRKCAVCRIPLEGDAAVLRRGDDVWEFCCEDHKERFMVDPQKYELPEEDEE